MSAEMDEQVALPNFKIKQPHAIGVNHLPTIIDQPSYPQVHTS